MRRRQLLSEKCLDAAVRPRVSPGVQFEKGLLEEERTAEQKVLRKPSVTGRPWSPKSTETYPNPIVSLPSITLIPSAADAGWREPFIITVTPFHKPLYKRMSMVGVQSMGLGPALFMRVVRLP